MKIMFLPHVPAARPHPTGSVSSPSQPKPESVHRGLCQFDVKRHLYPFVTPFVLNSFQTFLPHLHSFILTLDAGLVVVISIGLVV